MLKILLRVLDIAGESIFRNFGDIPYMSLDLLLSSDFIIFSISDFARTLNLVVLGPEICDEKTLFSFWKLTYSLQRYKIH